jgi:FkbM family methyltransferase
VTDRYTDYQGWKVPTWDDQNVLDRRISQAMEAVAQIAEFCPPDKRRVAVQAGGSWGPWPLAFSEIFDTVYTFEPDSECFCCLAANTAHKDNVIRFQAGLGYENDMVSMVREIGSTGSQKTKVGGIIPSLRIDNLGLTDCDLIYLDVEGDEHAALFGAHNTIMDCSPVVAFEDRPFPTEDVKEYMESFGYHEIGRIGHDCVMSCSQ